MPRKLRLILASILAISAVGAIAPAANAYVYWTNYAGDTIGRSDLGGASAYSDWFSVSGTNPSGIAVDGGYIYWSSPATNTIARSKLDGTEVESNFITDTNNPIGIAVDSTHIYWANGDTNSIGRAKLDGTDVNKLWITDSNSPYGVAVDSNYLYWSDFGLNSIGRANLDGTEANSSFISSAGHPYGITVNDQYIYWTRPLIRGIGNSIARAKLDGTDPDLNLITGADSPSGIAVDNQYIYWADSGSNSIGRANLVGSNPSFITGANYPVGVAIDSLSDPTISRVGKPVETSLKVRVGCGDANNACTLRLTGHKAGVKAPLVPKRVLISAGASKTVRLTYTKALRQALAKGGRVEVTVTNTVSGGNRSIIIKVAR